MHNLPGYIVLLISIPQTLLIIGFGFRLFNIQLKVFIPFRTFGGGVHLSTLPRCIILSLKLMRTPSNGIYFMNPTFPNQ